MLDLEPGISPLKSHISPDSFVLYEADIENETILGSRERIRLLKYITPVSPGNTASV